MLTGLIKSVLIKIFPSLSYKGVVDAQIKFYKRLVEKGASEQDALDELIDSRSAVSDDFDKGASEYYQDVKILPNKTLTQTIKAIVEWEYLYNMKSYELRAKNKIPPSYVDEFKNEVSKYIESKVAELKLKG